MEKFRAEWSLRFLHSSSRKTRPRSQKTTDQYAANKLGPPAELTLENFEYAFLDAGLNRFVVNSLIMLTGGLIGYILVCAAAGFAFGRLNFRFKLSLFTAVLFLMIFPQMMLSVPVFQIVAKLQLLDTYIGVILVWIAYFTPYGTYIMATYFASVPRSLYESAKIDGANIFQILFRVMIPIAKPMMITIGILGFQGMWSELPFSLLILRSVGKRTLTLGVAMMRGQYGLPTVVQSAAIVVTAVLPLIFFAVAQRHIRTGSTAGALKG